MFFDYNDVNFNTRLCLLKYYAIFENSAIIEWIKLTLSSENKFCDKKESSLTKYYRIRSKLTVNFLRTPLNTRLVSLRKISCLKLISSKATTILCWMCFSTSFQWNFIFLSNRLFLCILASSNIKLDVFFLAFAFLQNI